MSYQRKPCFVFVIKSFQAGYKNICEIGKERIRRAGKKILEECRENAEKRPHGLDFANSKSDGNTLSDKSALADSNPCGNKEDSYRLDVGEDRTPLDLLFQVMPECNLPLSSKIEEGSIEG